MQQLICSQFFSNIDVAANQIVEMIFEYNTVILVSYLSSKILSPSLQFMSQNIEEKFRHMVLGILIFWY